MARIIYKSTLPRPEDVPPTLRAAATAAPTLRVREPRPAGFPLLFSSTMQLIEPAVAFLHEHSIQRAHTAETLRTYAEILLDWFNALEQVGIRWSDADAVDLVLRMAALQSALLGHIEPPADPAPSAPATPALDASPLGAAVSMFGFSCKDPFSGVAPGTHRGSLCTNFLACLTCPNAVIPTDAPTLARLLQARDHLQAAATHIHPARWAAIYAPQVRILEEDLIPRFPARERPEAERLRATLSPLLPLR